MDSSPFRPTHALYNIYVKHFDDEVYRQAESSLIPCRARIDSSSPKEQEQSVILTNRIIFCLNKTVLIRLREIPIYPHIGAHIDPETVEAVDQIFRVYLAACPQSLGIGEAKELRIELWARTLNIMRSRYPTEMGYLVNFYRTAHGLSLDDATGAVGTNCPGSIADAIGYSIFQRTVKHAMQLAP